MQASLLPIEDTFGCTVSGTLIDINNYVIINQSVYNGDLVTNNNGVPTLNTDVVTLDSPTLVPEEEEDYDDFDDFDLDEDYTDEELEPETETIVAVTQDLVDISNVYANPNLDDNTVTNMVRTIDVGRYTHNTHQSILDYFNIIPQRNAYIIAGTDATDLDFSSNR
jgi:hypothetical protein